MRGFRRRSQRPLLLVVLAVGGFLTAGVVAGVGLAWNPTTTQTTPSTTTTPTTTTTPEGKEGCTPGFWKNHPEDWEGFSTDQTLASVFGPTGLGGLGSTTLLDALSFKGGSTITAAKRILLRHAVAALLNSAHSGVDFGMTTAEVIAAVNAALSSNDRAAILAAKNVLAGLNESGCPL
jgi:uncharacterized membrane protein